MTHTRTHVHIELANPYLTCDQCKQWITGWHDDGQCGCDASYWNVPCEHRAGVTSACPSWGPVDGCSCQQHLGHVPHGEPPAPAETSAEAERRQMACPMTHLPEMPCGACGKPAETGECRA